MLNVFTKQRIFWLLGGFALLNCSLHALPEQGQGEDFGLDAEEYSIVSSLIEEIFNDTAFTGKDAQGRPLETIHPSLRKFLFQLAERYLHRADKEKIVVTNDGALNFIDWTDSEVTYENFLNIAGNNLFFTYSSDDEYYAVQTFISQRGFYVHLGKFLDKLDARYPDALQGFEELKAWATEFEQTHANEIQSIAYNGHSGSLAAQIVLLKERNAELEAKLHKLSGGRQSLTVSSAPLETPKFVQPPTLTVQQPAVQRQSVTQKPQSQPIIVQQEPEKKESPAPTKNNNTRKRR